MDINGPALDYAVEMVHLARLALAGRPQDVSVFLRRLAKRLQPAQPQIASQLNALLATSAAQGSSFRAHDESSPVPRDADSRLQLIRIEHPASLDVEPIWDEKLKSLLDQVIAERTKQSLLIEHGLTPTRTVLCTGAPGVGKTLAARWIAHRLDRPLFTLDLSAVMSSFLGKTGSNLRYVLDYAKETESVLFLDELDAIAKRRDDTTEIGELKRLVTVLLQEVDDWPSSGLLLAATNHPDLLDPAVWRRFEMILDFPMPSPPLTRQAVEALIGSRLWNADLLEVVSVVLSESSFSDISRELNRVIRQSVMGELPLESALQDFVRSKMSTLKLEKKKILAGCLLQAGFTQRETHEWTGIHRDTLRKMARAES